MLVYLESEVHELQEEIISMHSVRDGSDASSGRKHPSYSDRKKAMIAELGDVLFDVLMLEMMMRREYEFGIDEAWQVASEKVERRTPYMQEWGNGISVAKNTEEAEEIWQSVKRQEKADRLTNVDSQVETLDLSIVRNGNAIALTHIKTHGNLLGSAILGFALGVLFCGGKQSSK